MCFRLDPRQNKWSYISKIYLKTKAAHIAIYLSKVIVPSTARKRRRFKKEKRIRMGILRHMTFAYRAVAQYDKEQS